MKEKANVTSLPLKGIRSVNASNLILLSTSIGVLRPSQGFWGPGEQGHFFQGNKGLKIRGTGEHKQFWRTGNIENQDFVFREQRNKAIFSRGFLSGKKTCLKNETLQILNFILVS